MTLLQSHMLAAAQDVVVGKPVRPQLAKAAKDPQEALDGMKGKPFLLETKFDGVETADHFFPGIACMCRSPICVMQYGCCHAGERMQVHRNGDVIQWFSRKGIDHGVQSDYNVLNPLVKERLKSTKCVLDGELLIWNTARWAVSPLMLVWSHLVCMTAYKQRSFMHS